VDLRAKKGAPPLAASSTDEGKTWVWVAFAAKYRLFLALVVGSRTQEQADQLIRKTATVLAGSLPLFCSDGLEEYAVALLDRYFVTQEYPSTGRPGRPRQARRLPAPQLRYAQVVKRQENARLTRKTLAFSKNQDDLRAQLALYVAYANLVRKHRALRVQVDEPVCGNVRRRWVWRTPAMAAGCTDHVWTLRQLLTCHPSKTSIY